MGDRLAERLALLDVRRHVVEDRLGRCRPRGRTTPAATAARTRRTSTRRSRRAGPWPGTRTPSRVSRASPAARTPIAGSSCHGRGPRAPLSTRTSTGSSSSSAPDHEEHRRRCRAAPATSPRRAPGRRRRGERWSRAQHVEEHARLGQGQGRGRHVVAGELRQVGLLLLLAAPERRAPWRPSPGARVATARPRSPCASASATRVPAIAERSSEMPPSDSGTPSTGSPISSAGLEHRLGGRAGVVGLGRGRAHHLRGELGRRRRPACCSSSVGVRSKVPEPARRRHADAGGAGCSPAGRTPGSARVAVVSVRKPLRVTAWTTRSAGLRSPTRSSSVALGEPVEAGDQDADRVARLGAGEAVAGSAASGPWPSM